MSAVRHPTVLLVEDEPIIRMGLADHIARQGFAVIEAGSGDRAMEMVRNGNLVDIIITDVQMPGQHDGIALALWTRRNFPHIKLIIVSGATSGAVAPDLLGEEGRIMPKPYQYDEIVARMRELLERPDSSARSPRRAIFLSALPDNNSNRQ